MRQRFVNLSAVAIVLGLGSACGAAPAQTPVQMLWRCAMGEISGSTPQDAVNLSPHLLRAGPVHLKLQDGQLRYIRVGDKEIIRRIYFAVRDGDWATAMPTYTLMQVEDGGDHFTVRMAADCRMGKVDFSWKGVVTGSSDGTITFHAEGTPNADFNSNRIGLCVLYGNKSLVTQRFETDGTPAKGAFPPLVSPTLVASQFHRLQYSTESGLNVSCSLEGAIFDMEDQRNWGDSSWKAYAPLPYTYKSVTRGDVKAQTVTLTVTGVNAANSLPTISRPVVVSVGQPLEGMTIPVLLPAHSIDKPIAFTDFSFNRDPFADKTRIDWSYIPTSHLPDDDTIMENLPALTDQAKTTAAFAKKAPVLRVGPITIDPKANDPRGEMPIGAAWLVGMVHSLAAGHVQAAEFSLKGKTAAAALAAVRPYAGWQLWSADISPKGASDILAFGCYKQDQKVLYIINCGSQALTLKLSLHSKTATIFNVTTGATTERVPLPVEGLPLELQPYEVCRVNFANQYFGH